MSAWHSVFWSPSKRRWLVRVGTEGRAQRQITVPQEVAPGPRSKKAAEQWAAEQIAPQNAMEGKKVSSLAELAPISGLDAAVPDAVREARDGLRWMLVAWDGAEAMLAGLETS